MIDLTANFPAIAHYTYVNTPATGLIPKAVNDYRANQYTAQLNQGSLFFDENVQTLAEVREEIASFFKGRPENVALMPAFSYGFNALLEGLKPQTRILLLTDDYPSINWAVEARDFQLSYATIDAHTEEHIRDAFKRQPPEVFIFSMVQYLNGIKIDLSFLKALKKEFPETLFIGDGTQYLGTERFDFAASRIDVLGASTYKWVGAGFGNGFFMFKPGLEEYIHPKHLGFGSIMGKYKEKGDTLIGKFEGNHLDIAALGSIKVALEFQEKVGVKIIEKQVHELGAAAKEAFTALNLLETAVVDRKQHSSIFNIKGDEQLFKKLNAMNIMCSQRGSGIRVGFHYYNTLEDLYRLVNALQS